jgi:hypothetical protein
MTTYLMFFHSDLENRLLHNDLNVTWNHGVDHEGCVGHQKGVGEPRRHAHQGGGSTQLVIPESDFESNSESKTTLHSN